MQQLRANAQNAIANLQAYREAIGKAQSAFNSHEYADSLTWATGALQKIPGDAAAIKIKDSSQQFINAFNSLSSQAQAAYQKEDLGGAVVATDKALAIFPKDAKMQKLKADVLRRLDGTLQMMLQQFNISVPAELKYAVDKKYPILGAIGSEKKPYYDQVDWLEKVYRLGNWLGTANRQAIIYDLRKRIDNWD